MHVRGVPDRLYERLRMEAKASRRSISAETIELLRRALQDPSAGPALPIPEFLERTDRIRARSRRRRGSPTAVELIREDRDR